MKRAHPGTGATGERCSIVGSCGGLFPLRATTLFLHHFDDPGNAGPASYSVGSPTQTGTGGTIVSGDQFGNALNRGTGTVQYATAGNFNVNLGTIEMWIKGSGVTGGGFVGLWGTDTSSGAGDIRMYIYDTGADRTLVAYQLGGGGSFWEIEQAIPVALLDSTNWHHVVWAFDTAAGKTATWWDGQLLRNTPDAGTVNPRTAFTGTRMNIGANQSGNAIFPGFIDEFRISDSIVYDMNQDFVRPSAPFDTATPEPTSVLLVASGVALTRLRRRRVQ